jgi:hyperosmotically inducible protein
MKSKLIIASLFTACMALPLAAQAADMQDKAATSKVWVKDSVITTKIKASFAAHKPVNLSHVKVDTDANGYVMLSGKVKNKVEAEQAESLAKTVQGVKTVENRIEVSPS